MLARPPESMNWLKSSYSGSGEHCVELGHVPGERGIRDSKLGAASPVIRTSPAAFAALLAHVRGVQYPG